MPQFKKKPVVIEAVQWTGKNVAEMNNFAAGHIHGAVMPDSYFTIGTLEGTHTASVGDWIIKEVAGEFYTCKPDIFQRTYDPV